MSNKLRRGQIARLTDDIGLIGDDFEEFGAIVMDHFLPIRLNHPGLNLLGFPVGYTVDTVDPDGKVVAEYSALKNYFYKNMPKAQGDLAHALAEQPGAEMIYLLSSNKLANAPVKAFRAVAYQRPDMKDRKLRVWGAVEIATVIRDEFLFNDLAVDQLATFLPALRKIRDEEAVTLEARERDDRHLDLPEVDAELERRLKKTRCVEISGIAGSGKSATAASYAARRAKSYDLVIWLDGSKLDQIKALKAVPVSRGGENRNIPYLLANQRCLLVLDDVEASLDPATLAALCRRGSRIIITRRRSTANSYDLPATSPAISRQLLDRDLPIKCPDEAFRVIWERVGGHPLTLGLINADVRNGTPWADIILDCDAIGELNDDGTRLADRLLERLRQPLASELSLFQWIGHARCDRAFLIEAIKPVGLRKLRDNSLTAADRPSVVRLHDIIFAALGTEPLQPSRSRKYEDALEAYIARVAQQNTLDFWNVATILRPKLEALARAGERRPAYLYALLETWTPAQVDTSLLGDPAAAASALSGVSDRMAIMAIIETIEKQYLHDKTVHGRTAAQARVAERLPVFDTLAALPGLNERQAAEIDHHKAKALLRADRPDDAITLFEELLTKAFVLPETKQQLVRLYKSSAAQSDRVEAWTREILDEAAAGLVGRSLVLAAIEGLPWGDGRWRRDLIAERRDQMEATLVTAAEAGMPQAYRALASIGRYWAKHDPETLKRVFNRVPPWSVEGNLDDGDRAAYGEVLLELSKLGGDGQAALHEEAEAFFTAIVAPENYQQQRHAELLLDMGRALEARNLLEKHEEGATNVFVKRLMARALLALDEPKEALAAIDEALSGLEAERFRSSFLELRFRIRLALYDSDAIDDLVQAVGSAAHGVERAALAAALEAFASAGFDPQQTAASDRD